MAGAVNPRVAALIYGDGADAVDLGLKAAVKRQDLAPGTIIEIASRPGDPEFLASLTAELNQLSPEIEWIWLLDHNVEVAADTLAQLVRRVELSPSAAMVGAKQLQQQDRSIISSLGISLSQLAEPLRLYAGEFDQGQHNSDSDVLAVDLNCSLASRSGLQSQLKHLTDSPALAFGYELGMRLRAAGYRILVEPDSRCWVAEDIEAESVSSQFKKLTARIQLSALVLPLAWMVGFWLAAPLLVLVSIAAAFFKKLPAQAIAAPAAIAWGWVTLPRLLRSRASFRSSGEVGGQRDFWLGRAAVRKLRMVKLAQLEAPAEKRVRLLESGIVWWMLVPLLASYQLFSLAVPRSDEFPPISRSLAELTRTAFSSTQPYWSGVPTSSDPISWVWLIFGLLSPAEPGIAMSWFVYLAPALCYLLMVRLLAELTQRRATIVVLSMSYALNPLLVTTLLQGNAAAALFYLLVPLSALAIRRVFHGKEELSWSWWAVLGLATFFVSALYPLLGAILALAVVIATLAKQPKRISPAGLALAPSLVLVVGYAFELLGNGAAWIIGLPLFPEVTQLAGLWLVPLALVFIVWGGGLVRLGLSELLTATTLVLAAASWFWSFALAQAVFSVALVASLIAIASRGTGDTETASRPALIRVASKVGIVTLASSALFGGVALAIQEPQFKAGNSATMPALVAATAEVDPSVRTLVIDLSDGQTAAELIWNDGRNLDEVSLRIELTGAELQLETKQQISRLVAGLIAGNSQVAGPALDRLGVAYILVVAPSPDVTRSLSTISGLASSGLTEFGELWRNVEYQSSPSPSEPPSLIQWATLWLLAILTLLAIPKPRLAKRGSVESPIFDEVAE